MKMDTKKDQKEDQKADQKQTTKVGNPGDEMIKSYQKSIPSLTMKDGLPFPGLLLTKRFDEIKDFAVREDDLLIAGYPRSGNHWMKEVMTQLYADDTPAPQEPTKGKHAFERIPILEMAIDLKQCMQIYMDNYFRGFGAMRPALSKVATKFGLISSEKLFSQTFLDPLNDLADRPSPRLYHTHLPFHMLPQGCQDGQCKIIYIMRNGKDVAVSFYEMHKMYPPFGYYSGNWKEFFYTYLKGEVCFGSWFKHIQEWWSKRSNKNILFVSYEDMIENLPREVKRIADFVNKDLSGAQIDEIVQRCTFSSMRDNPTATYDGLHESIDTKKTSFLRRGKVADWKSRMTVEDSEFFDGVYQQHVESFEGLNLRFELTTQD